MISSDYQDSYHQRNRDESPDSSFQYQESQKLYQREEIDYENEHSQQSSEDQIVQYLKNKKESQKLTSISPAKKNQRENQNPTPSTKQPRFIVKDKPQSQNDITVEIDRKDVENDYEDAKRTKLAQLKQEILSENDLIEQKQNDQLINNYIHNSLSSKDHVLNETFPVETKSHPTNQNSIDSQPGPKRLQQSPQIKGNRKFPKYSPIPTSNQSNLKKEEKNKSQLNSRRSPRPQAQAPPRSPRLGYQGGNQSKGNLQQKRECRSPRQNNYGKSEAQVSDKSRQIYFKKLQKEVEQAIRESDTQANGGLTIDDLKQCFFHLDYFPSMQQKINNGNKPTKTFDFTYQNTLRNQLIQEKVFLFNLWQMLNPLNQQTIDNAMIYDVLLLLIYNVSSPPSVSSSFLGEYLLNMYKEQKIDIESFSAFNSNHNETQDDTLADENMQNVNKYLEFNNIWTIDKLAQEFKAIHGHKVALVQNQNKRSRSPSPNFGCSSMTRSPRNIDPTDNRRYKKDVIEQVNSLTFKPNLGHKTKDLDEQLTMKLLQESQQLQNRALQQSSGARRENSADALMRSKQALTDDSNSVNQQLSSMQRYELLFYRQHLADQRIERAKENMQNKELNECSFQPQLVSNYKSQNAFKTYANPSHQANNLIKELNDKIEKSRRKYELIEIEKQEKEMAECTFKPQINSLMAQKKANQQPNQVPKGYYEQINRMRKIAEEKKQREQKEHKRVIGENYDKVKLMNSKPPSFLQQDASKRKRKLLMYVDVNITPTKTGRIGIYEGDDIKEVAKNFAKTFQLNNQMYQMLIRQLDQHLQSYREKMGIQNTFSGKAPFSILSDNNIEIDEQDEEYEDTSNNHSPHSNRDIRGYMEQMVSEKSSREGWQTKSPGTKFQNQKQEYSYS